MTKVDKRRLSAACFFFLFTILCSCSKQGTDPDLSADSPTYEPGKTQVLTAEASGTLTASSDSLTLDFSNAAQGYFTGILSSADTKINLQVIGPDEVTYKYFLEESDQLTVFPLTAGDGEYIILAFEQISEDQYSSLFTYPLEVTLKNEFLPFLYPNQYVNFTADSKAVSLAQSLSENAPSDLDALNLIYHYVTETISYDDEKAASVQLGYLPDIDVTLSEKKGICFDYASLTTAMLRSLSIPARLEIGYSNEVRHAWIDVYIESIGWVEHAIEFNGNEWKLMDPTFASAADDPDLIQDYIGNGENYTLQYVR